MEEKDIIQQEESKIQDFVGSIEAGNANTEYSKVNQNAIKDFLIEQRRIYADAANRASRISKNSYEYSEHAQTMSDVIASVNNLATQKNALLEAQGSFISDYENGLISKANSLEENGSRYADAFTGRMKLDIDGGGNILFNNNGKQEPLQKYTNYTMKDYSTAQNILDMTNKVYNSGKPLNPHYEQLITASIKEQLAKGGRNTLMSLWTDNMVPGLDYKSIDKEYFKPENTEKLFNLTVDKLSKGIAQVSAEGYNAKELEKQKRASSKTGSRTGTGNTRSSSITSADLDLARRIKEKTNRIKGKSMNIDGLVIGNRYFVFGQDTETKKQGWIESASPAKYIPIYEDEGAGKVYSDLELLNITTASVKKAYDSLNN